MATFASKGLSEQTEEEEDKQRDEQTEIDRKLGIVKSGPRKLATGEVSSIFNLKNELLKKQGKVQKVKLDDSYVSTKSSILKTKKEEKEAADKEKYARDIRIAKNEKEIMREENERLRKEKLNDKAALYDRMANGGVVLEHRDEQEVELMVDFGAKKRQKEEEKSRLRRERDEFEHAGTSSYGRAPVPEHYHHSEEQRVYGTSHMRFSMNDDKRREEIQDLLEFSKQTTEEQKQAKKEKDEKEAKRLEKINRLRIRNGLEPIKPPSPPPEVNLDDIPVPSPMETPEDRHIRLMKSDREWDRGKGLYTTWIEKQRDERDDEFAPPSNYYK